MVGGAGSTSPVRRRGRRRPGDLGAAMVVRSPGDANGARLHVDAAEPGHLRLGHQRSHGLPRTRGGHGTSPEGSGCSVIHRGSSVQHAAGCGSGGRHMARGQFTDSSCPGRAGRRRRRFELRHLTGPHVGHRAAPLIGSEARMILSLAAADPRAPHGPRQGHHNTRRYSAPERLRPNQPPVLGPCKAPWWRPAVAWCAPGSQGGRRRGSLEGTARGSVCEFAAPSAWASTTGQVERGPILSSGKKGTCRP